MSDIITERSESILRVQLNRPAKKNAMTSSMYVTLADILDSVRRTSQEQKSLRPSNRLFQMRRFGNAREERARSFPQETQKGTRTNHDTNRESQDISTSCLHPNAYQVGSVADLGVRAHGLERQPTDED